jgi:hypothetical protein
MDFDIEYRRSKIRTLFFRQLTRSSRWTRHDRDGRDIWTHRNVGRKVTSIRQIFPKDFERHAAAQPEQHHYHAHGPIFQHVSDANLRLSLHFELIYASYQLAIPFRRKHHRFH